MLYTELEVIEMLVNNMNRVMKMIDSKYYTIDKHKETVMCYRKNRILKDRLLSEYTFNYIIQEAKGFI